MNRDKENLAVISDHGVIEKLSNLTQTENDMLRAKLALAIGNCCEWAGKFYFDDLVVLAYRLSRK